jgi:hypothetical protein
MGISRCFGEGGWQHDHLGTMLSEVLEEVREAKVKADRHASDGAVSKPRQDWLTPGLEGIGLPVNPAANISVEQMDLSVHRPPPAIRPKVD